MSTLAARLLGVWTRVVAWCPHPATAAIGCVVGLAARIFRTRPAEITATNIEHCFPELDEAARGELVRSSLAHTGRLFAEAGIVFRWSQAKLDALVQEVEGLELLESNLAAGRGVMLLVPHFGNWDYLGLFLGRYGVLGLYDPPRIGSLDTPIRKARERTGATLAPIGPGGLRRALRSLHEGGLIAVLPDQTPARNAGVYAPFFGLPALTATLVHRFAQRAQPVVLLSTAQRVAGGFRIRFLRVDPGIGSADVVTSVAVMNSAIEQLVREEPAQYQWEYKRFKKPPAGSVDIYRA